MFTALILIILVLAIAGASRRWPDIERRLWPNEVGTIPRERTAEPPSEKPAPRAHATKTAGGIMHTKPLSTEPDVDPEALEKKPKHPHPHPKPVPAKEEAPVAEAPAEPAPAKEPAPKHPTPLEEDGPGGHVTGRPAMPSQPAYYDATGSSQSQSVDELGRQADQAYRERNYSVAEKACLKILMREPKNHKYMTRIGQIYQEMGQLEDAREAFEAAKKLDPKNFFVLNRLSEVTRLLEEKGK